jgi:hypothetical protein
MESSHSERRAALGADQTAGVIFADLRDRPVVIVQAGVPAGFYQKTAPAKRVDVFR